MNSLYDTQGEHGAHIFSAGQKDVFGSRTITGTVSKDGSPYEARVFIYDQIRRLPWFSTWSNADGDWSVSGVSDIDNTFLIIAIDPASVNPSVPVVQDHVGA